MPFDGLNSVLLKHDTLPSLLDELGIEPVSNATLRAHKVAEVKKHPHSWFWKRPAIYQMSSLACAATTMACIMSTVVEFTQYCRGAASLSAVLCVAMAAVLSFVLMCRYGTVAKVTSPAYWVEEQSRHLTGVPESIRELGLKVANEDHNVTFIVGKLMQHHVVLDPYLLVEKTDRQTGERTRACLGIWDDTRIIQIAQSK